jgi:hypothetical protein
LALDAAGAINLSGSDHKVTALSVTGSAGVNFKNELNTGETLIVDQVNGGTNTVSITENTGSIQIDGTISAGQTELTAGEDIVINGTGTIRAGQSELTAGKHIVINGTNPFDQAQGIVFTLGGAMTCASASTIEADDSITIRPFDRTQNIYVAMSGGPGDLSIPQDIFGILNAPKLILGGEDGNDVYARGNVCIGNFVNGSSGGYGGYDVEIMTENDISIEQNMRVIGAAAPDRTIKLSAKRLVMQPHTAILPDSAVGSNIHITLEIDDLDTNDTNKIESDLIQLYPIGTTVSPAAKDKDIQYSDLKNDSIMPKDSSGAPAAYIYYSSSWDVLYADQYIIGHEYYNGDIYVSGVARANYELQAKNNGSIYFYGDYTSIDKTFKLHSNEIILFNTAKINVGAAAELLVEKNLVVRSSGLSGDAETSITGSGNITITGSITGTDGVSFAVNNTVGSVSGNAVIQGPIAMNGAFSYTGASIAIGNTDVDGSLTGVTAPAVLLDTPLVKGNIAFDGDVEFARGLTECAGRIENRKTMSVAAAQTLWLSGKYAGMAGSLLQGTDETTEIHFRKNAEFSGDDPHKPVYKDNGSWLVFSGTETQEFNSGGISLGNIRIDKGGGELRIVMKDLVQKDGATLDMKEGLLNLVHAGGAWQGWTIGASGEPARAGNFAGRGGTLVLDNSSGIGAEVRAMDIVLGEQCALDARGTGVNTLAAMGNIAVGKNSKNFGTSRTIMIPGAAVERTQIESEVALYTLIVLRNAKLAGDITVTEMQLGSPAYAPLEGGPPVAYTGGISLDGGSSVIRVLGNWTNHSADVDSDGVSRAFVYGTGRVIFDRTASSGKVIAIRGGSAWYDLVCETPGAVIGFDNYPRRHYVAHGLAVKGTADGYVTLTRLNDTGQPARKPPDTTMPAVPLTEEDHKNYWDFVILPGADGSGGIKLELENTIIAYSNSSMRAPIPPGEKNVLAWPFYSRDNPLPPVPNSGADYQNCSYYNINWVLRYGFVYAFTEDTNGNGRIDRIRAQASYELNTAAGGAFDKFSVKVTKGNETEEWIRVAGYEGVPGFSDSLYINLEEHDYADGGARDLTLEVVGNESLTDLATGLSFVKNLESGPLLTIDTVFPRISYALMLPNSSEAFVQFSENIDDGSLEFVYPDNRKPAAVLPVGSGKNEFELDFAETGYAVQDLAAGPLFAVTGVHDGAAWARDLSEDNPDYPSPKYPVDWTYSDYMAVPGNPPDTSRGYRLAPGDLANPASLAVLVPPNALPGGTLSHRVTDLLVSDYPGEYFAVPVWAVNQQENAGVNQESHVVRVFDGRDYLEDRDITLEVNVNPALGAYAPVFIFGSAIPGSYKVGASPVDPDFGVPHGIAGLWLPGFDSLGYDGGLKNDFAFSNIVAKPYLPAYALAPLSNPASASNFDFRLEKNSSAYTYAGISMLEFFLRLIPAAPNPASEDLYIGRLGKGSPWYRHVEPFKFELHNITRQRGGVTVLNNVIKPSTGEQVYVDYALSRNGPVTIQVFTLDGNLVKVLARETKAAGEYRVGWDGKNNGGREVARGLYFIRVVAPDIDEIRKVMVVR